MFPEVETDGVVGDFRSHLAYIPHGGRRLIAMLGGTIGNLRPPERAAMLAELNQAVQSMADASPTKWHRAHTTWFFETFVLQPNFAGYQPFDEHFCYLFNSYYEAVGPRHLRAERGLITRPDSAAVGAYRKHVDGAMLSLLARGVDDPLAELIELGLHHEQQHQELILMDALHLLSRNPTDPIYDLTFDSPVVSDVFEWRGIAGGWATSPGHARRTYRNFFPTSARWCVGGLRLAR